MLIIIVGFVISVDNFYYDQHCCGSLLLGSSLMWIVAVGIINGVITGVDILSGSLVLVHCWCNIFFGVTLLWIVIGMDFLLGLSFVWMLIIHY